MKIWKGDTHVTQTRKVKLRRNYAYISMTNLLIKFHDHTMSGFHKSIKIKGLNSVKIMNKKSTLKLCQLDIDLNLYTVMQHPSSNGSQIEKFHDVSPPLTHGVSIFSSANYLTNPGRGGIQYAICKMSVKSLWQVLSRRWELGFCYFCNFCISNGGSRSFE